MCKFCTYQSLLSPYVGADGVEAVLDVGVATVDLVDMVDAAGALGTHGGDEHGDTGTDIGTGHVVVLELARVVVADDDGTVRVAEDDLGTHVNQFVHEEETTLEHLLVDQHRATCLGGHHEDDRQEVRRQSGPRRVGHGEDRAVEERVDLVMVLRRDDDIIAIDIEAYAQAAERIGDDTEITIADILDTQFGAGDGSHADERADLDHIRQKSMLGAMQHADTLDSEEVRPHSADTCAHAIEQAAELLQIGFAGGVVDSGGTLGHDSGHDDISRAGDGGLVEEHIRAAEVLAVETVGEQVVVVTEGSTEVDHALEMGVETSTADLIASGLGIGDLPQSCQEGSDEHDRSTQFVAFLQEIGAAQIVLVELVCREGILAPGDMIDSDAHRSDEVDEVVDIEDVGQVVDDNRLSCEEHGAEHLQRLVLRALGRDTTVQLMSTFYDK